MKTVKQTGSKMALVKVNYTQLDPSTGRKVTHIGDFQNKTGSILHENSSNWKMYNYLLREAVCFLNCHESVCIIQGHFYHIL